jgi:hypothetical protein
MNKTPDTDPKPLGKEEFYDLFLQSQNKQP